MARLLTLTLRGEAKQEMFNPTPSVGGTGLYIWKTSSTPSGFDTPVYEQIDSNQAITITLSSYLTEGRLGFKFRPKNDDGSRLMALYEGGTRRVTLYKGTGTWGKRLYTDEPASVNAPIQYTMEPSPAFNIPHVVEVYWKCNGTSSIVRIFQNGLKVIEIDPCNLGTTGINKIVIGDFTNTYSISLQVEWVILEDSNTELAWTKFARLYPNAAGYYTELTPKPSGSNYQLVNEEVASPAGYNLADAADEKDTYNLQDCPNDVNAIKVLRVRGVAARQAESTLQVAPLLRIGSNDYAGNAVTIGNVHTQFAGAWTTNPATGNSWQVSEVNNLQVGIKAVSS